MDAVFVFDDSGMKVWSRIESDKIYLKFQELFAPLRNLYPVELYINRPREEKEAENGDNPPPSLWQNHELRSNLGDRAAQLSAYAEEQITLDDRSQTDALLKQRLLVYAEQTLSRNRKMDHYALDLFALARMALDLRHPVRHQVESPGDMPGPRKEPGEEHREIIFETWRRRFQALQNGKADLLNRRLIRMPKTSFFRKKQSGSIPILKTSPGAFIVLSTRNITR